MYVYIQENKKFFVITAGFVLYLVPEFCKVQWRHSHPDEWRWLPFRTSGEISNHWKDNKNGHFLRNICNCILERITMFGCRETNIEIVYFLWLFTYQNANWFCLTSSTSTLRNVMSAYCPLFMTSHPFIWS